MSSAPRVEVLRETVKVAKFELPPDALPEPRPSGVVRHERRGAPRWERHVAAALWAIAAAIVVALYLVSAR